VIFSCTRHLTLTSLRAESSLLLTAFGKCRWQNDWPAQSAFWQNSGYGYTSGQRRTARHSVELSQEGWIGHGSQCRPVWEYHVDGCLNIKSNNSKKVYKLHVFHSIFRYRFRIDEPKLWLILLKQAERFIKLLGSYSEIVLEFKEKKTFNFFPLIWRTLSEMQTPE
jgi:hypothetical protein